MIGFAGFGVMALVALPLLAVVTIPAAGSEMNGGMVLTNEETMDKLGTPTIRFRCFDCSRTAVTMYNNRRSLLFSRILSRLLSSISLK